MTRVETSLLRCVRLRREHILGFLGNPYLDGKLPLTEWWHAYEGYYIPRLKVSDDDPAARHQHYNVLNGVLRRSFTVIKSKVALFAVTLRFSVINPDHTQGDSWLITFGQKIPIDLALVPRHVGVDVSFIENTGGDDRKAVHRHANRVTVWASGKSSDQLIERRGNAGDKTNVWCEE